MGSLAVGILAYVRAFFVTRHGLALEAAALRQQLAVFKRKQPRLLKRQDRLFWSVLRQMYSGSVDTLVIVNPETVVSGHRAGFRLLALAIATGRTAEGDRRNPPVDSAHERR